MPARRVMFSAIDLFSGCGGLSLGLRRAGFKVLAAIDNDPLAISTYRANHARTHSIRDDIRLVDPAALMSTLGLVQGSLDLIAGCPPCQGFSTLRTLNGKHVVSEPVNDLVYEFCRFVEVFMPKTLMLENVPGLLRDRRLADIEQRLLSFGYHCIKGLFNAARYGVPQRRMRMIFLASRHGFTCFCSSR